MLAIIWVHTFLNYISPCLYLRCVRLMGNSVISCFQTAIGLFFIMNILLCVTFPGEWSHVLQALMYHAECCVVQSCLLGYTQKTALNIILAAVRTWNLTNVVLFVWWWLGKCCFSVQNHCPCIVMPEFVHQINLWILYTLLLMNMHTTEQRTFFLQWPTHSTYHDNGKSIVSILVGLLCWNK
jgi:hypothetical protein